MYIGPEALPDFFSRYPEATAGAQRKGGKSPKAARRQQRQENEVLKEGLWAKLQVATCPSFTLG